MNLKKGRLLVADPSILNDETFSRTVILLSEYTEESVVGFIMNRPLKITLNDVFPEVVCNFNIYEGGPVGSNNIYYMHTVPHLIPNSILIDGNLYWGGHFTTVKKLLKSKKLTTSNIRFYMGYCGWEQAQLDEEILRKSWFVSNLTNNKALSSTHKNLWKELLTQKGNEYALWSNAPKNVKWN